MGRLERVALPRMGTSGIFNPHAPSPCLCFSSPRSLFLLSPFLLPLYLSLPTPPLSFSLQDSLSLSLPVFHDLSRPPPSLSLPLFFFLLVLNIEVLFLGLEIIKSERASERERISERGGREGMKEKLGCYRLKLAVFLVLFFSVFQGMRERKRIMERNFTI